MLTTAIILALLALIAIYVITVYNSLIRLRNQVREGFSSMDIQMKKRYDLVPNIVETVKAYAGHEASTLENVIQARNSAINSSTNEEKKLNENMLTQSLKSIFALSEAYPDLKANTNFLALQQELGEIEDEIALSRSYYNGTVKLFNNNIEVFPNNIIANSFNFVKEEFFELDDLDERKGVKVDF